jgi:hypothetical protein
MDSPVDWSLIAVVVIAFIAGYSIVGLVVKGIFWQKTVIPGEEEANQSQQKEEKSDMWEFSSKDEQYARVLGLTPVVNAESIKRAYHDLLAKYHPDKVSHLGAEFKTIAEARTREIREAYDYFQKKYNIR